MQFDRNNEMKMKIDLVTHKTKKNNCNPDFY